MQELERELKQLLIEVLNLEDVSVEQIDSQAPLFGEGLGLDSIDALELGVAIRKKYNVQMFTSGQNHVRALRTLGIKKFVGASYFPEKMNNVFARYFTDAGFQVLAMEGIDSPFAAVPSVPPEQILEFMKRIAAKHKDADGIYMLGSAWKTVEIIDRLEKDTGLTVVHAGPARAWGTQLCLGLCHPIPGYGRLLAEMPS